MAVLLLIEDDAKIRTAMVRALTERGHAVASQPTGMAGLRHAIDERPDLVTQLAQRADGALLSAVIEVTDDDGEIVLEFPFTEAILDHPDRSITKH